MSGTNGMSEFDRRLGDWLEDGAQTVPDWVVDDSIQRAHGTPQLGAGLRLPWLGRGLSAPSLGRLIPLAAGALGALAVVTAFVLGLFSAPRIGDDAPTPSPTVIPTSGTPQPPRAAGGVEVLSVLPGDSGPVYALIGLASTGDAVWTVAVSENSETGEPLSRLIRIDAVTGDARVVDVPGVTGLLSPPAAQGALVWTGSTAGLHVIDSTGVAEPRSIPLGFQPLEIKVSPAGLWVSRDGGVSLVDPVTGQVLREIASHPESRLGRIIGPPISGSLWECVSGSLARVDPISGVIAGTVELPAGERDNCRYPVELSSVDGLSDGLLANFANVLIEPGRSAIAGQFDLGGGWSDIVVVDGSAWFNVSLNGSGDLALVELDPLAGNAAQTLTIPGSGYSTTAYQSPNLARAGDWVWVLADPTPDSADGPQIVRVPVAEF